MPPFKDVTADKARLRALALQRRAAMSVEARARASVAAAGQAMAHAPLLADAAGQTVALFASFRDEIDTAPLAAALRARGVGLALPVVVGDDRPLLFRRWEESVPLVRAGRFGIPTPRPECERVVPDVVVVPLAAFDRRGRRIGYGGGYYDRTLAELKAHARVFAVGLAFACQEIARVPAENHDESLDLMITEAEVFGCDA